MGKVATLQELETHWNFIDLLNAHEALDVQQEMEAEQKRKQ